MHLPAGNGGAGGRPPSESFTRIAEEEVLRTWLFTVGRATCADPEGARFERYIVHHPGAVAVVPVDHEGMVTLVRQLRPAVWADMLEIPAGTRDVAGEALDRTARRELAEEAGLEADTLRALATTYNSPGFCDQATTIFLATGLTQCATDRRGEEERWMSLERVRLSDVELLASTGRVRDQTTLLGLYMARAVLGG
ncbi:MAG: NUDIX domain-containing protein [Acidimicrobiales bacterium]